MHSESIDSRAGPSATAIELPEPAATDAFGRRLAQVLARWKQGLVVSLIGDLGAGKTALMRAILGALGEPGPVVSPSYTLVEPYTVAGRNVYHVDLYRLADPAELDYLGLRDINPATDWLFAEWADKGGSGLPPIDIKICLEYVGCARRATVDAMSERGADFWAGFEHP